jgi:hypothetical protein
MYRKFSLGRETASYCAGSSAGWKENDHDR